MMSQGNVCRLCVEICQDYKSLYDESGTANEVQQLMIQYFDENLLHMVTGNHFTVMCMKCWHQISDFSSFQQSIYRAQRILPMKGEEIAIKSEEEFLPEDHIVSEQPTDWNILAGEEATLPKCDKETACVPLADDTSNTDHSMDYEFGNESNSSELLVESGLIAECNEASKIEDRLTKSIPKKKRQIKRFSTSVKASDAVIAQWMPFLKCIFCTETCTTFSLLQRHFQDKHPLLKCQVKCCSRNYSQRCRFEDHIRLHIDSNAFACTFCRTTKTCRRTLDAHIREHHVVANDSNTLSENVGVRKLCRIKSISEIKPTLKCYLCPEKYVTYPLFRQHFSECHPEKKFYIRCCQRKLTSRCHILEHLQLHANPDEFKCKLCELRCKTQGQLKTHMRLRHPSKQDNKISDDLWSKWLPYTECAVCKEVFATLTGLECHFLECHPSEEFYVECCQQKLMKRREIIPHARYHVKPTDFKCDLCCLCYSYERGLQHHMRMVH